MANAVICILALVCIFQVSTGNAPQLIFHAAFAHGAHNHPRILAFDPLRPDEPQAAPATKENVNTPKPEDKWAKGSFYANLIAAIATGVLAITAVIGTCAALKSLRMLTKQTVIAGIAAKAANANAIAAKAAAEATRDSVNLIRDKERGRIIFSIEPINSFTALGDTTGEITTVFVLAITYHCPTPIFVSHGSYMTEVNDKIDDKPFGSALFGWPLNLKEGIVTQSGGTRQVITQKFERATIQAINEAEKFFHLDAFIAYKDIFAREEDDFTVESCKRVWFTYKSDKVSDTKIEGGSWTEYKHIHDLKELEKEDVGDSQPEG